MVSRHTAPEVVGVSLLGNSIATEPATGVIWPLLLHESSGYGKAHPALWDVNRLDLAVPGSVQAQDAIWPSPYFGMSY